MKKKIILWSSTLVVAAVVTSISVSENTESSLFSLNIEALADDEYGYQESKWYVTRYETGRNCATGGSDTCTR